MELNTVALQESEPPGCGHYPFLLILGSDPETLAIMRSKEGGVFAEIYIFANSKKRGDLHWQWGPITEPFEPENIDHWP